METQLKQRWAFWRQRHGRAISATMTASALVLSGSLIGWGAHAATAEDTPRAAANAIAEASPGIENSYAPLVAKVAPAVVTVRPERRNRAPQQFPFTQDPFFQDFFGDRSRKSLPEMPQRRQRGLGSGVIVRADGYILTNHHVIDGAEEIKIELSDRRVLKARLIGSDAPSDLAVLKVEATNLPTLPLGNSDQVRVGDVVLALGNPLGVGQTVTMGIVSAKGRATGLSDGSFEDFIQTDAPINQGNSGGALVNTRGELVGINSQILSPSGGNIGIGFAIPAGMAADVMAQLIEHGDVRRGMLGVTIQAVTPEIAESVRLPAVRGALVSSVEADGPAAKAGVKRGDVIIAIDGKAVADSNALRNQVARRQPGTTLTLTVLREGREQTLTANLARLAADRTAEASDAPANTGLGLAVEPLSAESAKRLGMEAGAGLLVTSVAPASLAEEAGFQPRDVIAEVNGEAVDSVTGLRDAIEKSKGRPALVLAHRDGRSIYLTLPGGNA